jgi:hypothetical protein
MREMDGRGWLSREMERKVDWRRGTRFLWERARCCDPAEAGAARARFRRCAQSALALALA